MLFFLHHLTTNREIGSKVTNYKSNVIHKLRGTGYLSEKCDHKKEKDVIQSESLVKKEAPLGDTCLQWEEMKSKYKKKKKKPSETDNSMVIIKEKEG